VSAESVLRDAALRASLRTRRRTTEGDLVPAKQFFPTSPE
jgi:hypothetical protein